MVHFQKKIIMGKTKPEGGVRGGLAKDQTFSGIFWTPSLRDGHAYIATYIEYLFGKYILQKIT